MSAALFGLLSTIAIYAASRALSVRYASPFTNPVVTAAPCIIALLFALGVDYGVYRAGARHISDLLAPAVVALAVPLYKHRSIVRRYALSACLGMVAGGAAALLAAVSFAKLLGLARELIAALGIKSATAPIAVQLGPIIGADPAICAVFAIGTGMTGALLGPVVLRCLRIDDPVARGLAYGSISHGIGTAQASVEGELQGAVAGVAMGCSALLIALCVPHLLTLLV